MVLDGTTLLYLTHSYYKCLWRYAKNSTTDKRDLACRLKQLEPGFTCIETTPYSGSKNCPHVMQFEKDCQIVS